MTLTKVLIKSDYDSFDDDVYNDFYSKILGESSHYSRLGGFFTSESLSLCAEGLQEFIKNNGQMKLILTPKFTYEDIKAIHDGVMNPENFINKEWISELDVIKDKFQADHVRALSWMLANHLLEIRIAIIKDENNHLLEYKQIEREEILTEQLGIFHDESGNSLSFRGIVNSLDIQKIRVYKNWLEDQKEYVMNDYKQFQKFWELHSEKLVEDEKLSTKRVIQTIPLSKAVREKFLTYVPENINNIRLTKPPKLFEYQLEAIRRWIDNKHIGLFEMATGTGKTFTAIGCIQALEKDEKAIIVVIVCPYVNLIFQWKSELSKWGYDSFSTADSNRKWLPEINSRIMDANYGIQNGPLIIITTYDTFSKTNFMKVIRSSERPVFLIADEVHSAGSEERRLGLLHKYNYRLGLSATPERYFDEEGTNVLRNYFGSVVYELNLENAIKRGFLCEYEYYPYFVDLTEEELQIYKNITRKIARAWNNTKRSKKDKNDLLELYIFERSRIIINAKEKLDKFKGIITDRRYVDYCLIYCSEKQINTVQKILDTASISNHRITSDIPKKPEDRVRFLEMFELGVYNALVAIKVLDEGLNIPAIKNAIILASTGNPKQYIQRRGRVLRKYKGTYRNGSTKEYARIFDIFVIPKITPSDDESQFRLERSIVKKEILRYEEMVRLSRNPDFGLANLRKIKQRFSIE